jgi:hypothetical protein
VHITREKRPHEVIDVTFEAAEAMQWVHGTRDNRNAQRLSFTRSHRDSVAVQQEALHIELPFDQR